MVHQDKSIGETHLHRAKPTAALVEQARAEGATAERERIHAVEAKRKNMQASLREDTPATPTASLAAMEPEERAENEWLQQFELHDEFASKAQYVAFRVAELNGLVKIVVPGTVTCG